MGLYWRLTNQQVNRSVNNRYWYKSSITQVCESPACQRHRNSSSLNRIEKSKLTIEIQTRWDTNSLKWHSEDSVWYVWLFVLKTIPYILDSTIRHIPLIGCDIRNTGLFTSHTTLQNAFGWFVISRILQLIINLLCSF